MCNVERPWQCAALAKYFLPDASLIGLLSLSLSLRKVIDRGGSTHPSSIADKYIRAFDARRIPVQRSRRRYGFFRSFKASERIVASEFEEAGKIVCGKDIRYIEGRSRPLLVE